MKWIPQSPSRKSSALNCIKIQFITTTYSFFYSGHCIFVSKIQNEIAGENKLKKRNESTLRKQTNKWINGRKKRKMKEKKKSQAQNPYKNK